MCTGHDIPIEVAISTCNVHCCGLQLGSSALRHPMCAPAPPKPPIGQISKTRRQNAGCALYQHGSIEAKVRATRPDSVGREIHEVAVRDSSEGGVIDKKSSACVVRCKYDVFEAQRHADYTVKIAVYSLHEEPILPKA